MLQETFKCAFDVADGELRVLPRWCTRARGAKVRQGVVVALPRRVLVPRLVG
jgi:hypothetical protein